LQSSLYSSEIILSHKGLYSVSNKTNRIKIGLQLYNLWQIQGHQLNWRIANSKTHFSYLWGAPSKPGICHILPKIRFLRHNVDLEIRFLAMQTLLRFLQ